VPRLATSFSRPSISLRPAMEVQPRHPRPRALRRLPSPSAPPACRELAFVLACTETGTVAWLFPRCSILQQVFQETGGASPLPPRDPARATIVPFANGPGTLIPRHCPARKIATPQPSSSRRDSSKPSLRWHAQTSWRPNETKIPATSLSAERQQLDSSWRKRAQPSEEPGNWRSKS
jgi:hypothetical protein